MDTLEKKSAPPDAKPGHENTNALHTVQPPPARWAWLAAPFDRPQVRRGSIVLLAVLALAFPFITDIDADIDAAANAAAYAMPGARPQYRRRLRRPARPRLRRVLRHRRLCLRHPDLLSGQPAWSGFWEPFASLGLVQKVAQNGAAIVHFTVSFWLMLPLSGVIAAFFGVLFGAPTLRLRGDYLAIVTLGFGEIVPIVVRNWTGLTNGAAGLNGVAAPDDCSATASASTPRRITMSALLMVALLIFVSIRLRDCRIGRAWMAIREDEIAAGAMGVDRTRFKLLAFAIGAAFRRHDRHVLCRQAADRDAGDVRLPGLRHDPGDGRARRHRQRLGRRARRRASCNCCNPGSCRT